MKRREFLVSAVALGMTSGLNAAIKPEKNSLIKPTRLKMGDTVALINPAGATAYRSDVEIVAESMEALGLRVKLGQHILDRYGYLAGSDENRAADVNRQFSDPDVKAILAIRGGWGCARILPLIDFAAIQKNPKILIGYSDVSALLLSIYSKTGLVTFHGPLGISSWNSFSVKYFEKILFNAEMVEMRNPKEIGDNLTQVRNRVQTIVPGIATGRLIAGNLSVLSAIVGSGYLPDWEKAVLVLEDIGENIYRIDRMLTQLKLAGILNKLSGFVFGKCTECGPGQGYGSLTLEQLFDDHIKPLNIPSWHGSMIGHIPRQFTLPIGVQVKINSTTGSIQMIESAVT